MGVMGSAAGGYSKSFIVSAGPADPVRLEFQRRMNELRRDLLRDLIDPEAAAARKRAEHERELAARRVRVGRWTLLRRRA